MVVFARAIDPKHLLVVFTLLLALTVISAFAGGQLTRLTNSRCEGRIAPPFARNPTQLNPSGG
jgi:hypothetical protein